MPSSSADSTSLTSHLTRKVQEALERADLRGGRLVAAVSGGPDSLALLHILAELRHTLGIRLHVAHLNHALRPEAGADARFVQEEAERLGVPITIEEADVAAFRKSEGLSLEQAARELRYAFLAKVARAAGAKAVALGHTADDQAETVLLHLVRGSGLQGLRGMEPISHRRVRDGSQLTLFRPLLEVTRQETEGYCHAKGLKPRLDATNRELRFPRNRLRWEVLPQLRQINPSAREALVRLSRAAEQGMGYLEGQVERVWPTVAARSSSGITLDRKRFQALHPALQPLLLRRAYVHLVGNAEGLTQRHLDRMGQLLAGPSGKSTHLPQRVRLRVSYATAHLGLHPATLCPLPPLQEERRIAVPGETPLDGWRVVASMVRPSNIRTEDNPNVAYLDLVALGGPVAVRARERGERFQPLGMDGSKRLQDFFVDAHVPREWRPRVPLVVSPRGVAWVVGWRIAHWARVTPETRRVLRLLFRLTQPEA